jgi:hypothetical protein
MSDNKLIVLWAIGAISVAPMVLFQLSPYVERGNIKTTAVTYWAIMLTWPVSVPFLIARKIFS